MSYWLYKKPNSAKWWARVKVPGRRPFSRSTATTVRRTAERVAEQLEHEALVRGAPVTLEEALTRWHDVQVDKGDSPHTLEITKRCGGHLVGFFGRHVDARSIELEGTTSYLRHRRQYVADATIAKELRTLRSALRVLKRLGLYDGEPAAIWPLGLAQSYPGRTRWVPPTEWRKLHLALAPRWRDHLVVYTWGGLRLSELFKVEPELVDLEGRRFFAAGTKTPKSKRWLPMHPEVEAVLRRRLQGHAGGPLFPCDADGYQPTRHRFAAALKRAARKARIAHVSPNDLRRTFCSWCRQAGIDKDDCADWLGHKNSQMVREVYGHDSAENAAAKLALVPSILVSPSVSPDDAAEGGSGST